MKAGTRRLGRCSTASPAMHSGRKLVGDKTDLKNVSPARSLAWAPDSPPMALRMRL